jgi:isoleucyl-tRNA synthetase
VEGLLAGGTAAIEIDGVAVVLTREDVLIERRPKPGMAVAAAGDLVVALDTELDAGLIQEGLAREFVNKVQGLRKAADLDIAQRIELTYSGDAEVQAAVLAQLDHICAETLAVSCRAEAPAEGEDVDLNGRACRIRLQPCAPGVR